MSLASNLDGQFSRPVYWSATRIIAWQIFALIYFQKLALTFSPRFQVSLSLICLTALLIPGIISGVFSPRKLRLVLLATFSLAAICSQALVPSFSVASLALLLVLCGILTLVWSVREDEYLAVCRKFSAMMVLPTLAVFLQLVFELLHGRGHSLSLEPIIPSTLLLKGFTYEASTVNWVVWNRPNGLIFLEPSFCSAFIACAFINEFHVLKRLGRCIFFLAGLLCTSGATGIIMVGVALVVAGFRRQPLLTMLFIAASCIVLWNFQALSLNLPLLSRVSELGNAGTSGYERLVLPIKTTIDYGARADFLFRGYGAGQITGAFGNPWPISKLTFEYGLLPAVLYFVFVTVSTLGSLNAPLRVALFIAFQFTGAYLLSPFMVGLIFLTCSGQIIRPGAKSMAAAPWKHHLPPLRWIPTHVFERPNSLPN